MKHPAPAHFRNNPRQHPADVLNAAERMVGIGFRCWVAGCDTGDVACWQTGWNFLEQQLGPSRVKPVAAELTSWVRIIHANTARKLEYCPMGCSGFCRDECTAISLIAACQHNACPALKACAFVLIGTDHVEPVIEASESFANLLMTMDVNLKENSILTATALAPTPTGCRSH